MVWSRRRESERRKEANSPWLSRSREPARNRETERERKKRKKERQEDPSSDGAKVF